MYKKTFNMRSKANYRHMSNLLIDNIFTGGSEIKIDFCKKANRITLTGDSMSDVFKFWRSIGKTPLEFYQYG